MGVSSTSRFGSLTVFSIAALISFGAGKAATQPVDLDALAANAAESMCSTNVLNPFPVRIENKVTNRTSGDAFSFAWPSAGPGGFTSSVTAGTTNGVGATWVWTTDQSILGFTGNSCPTDACFTQTGGPDQLGGFCSDACLADGTTVTVRKGATAGTVELSWTGGTAAFTVYRGATKIGVVAPTNSVGTTNSFAFTDTPPANANAFYVVRGVDCTTRKACASNNDCSGPTEGTCVSRGPFGVPGRSLLANDVTVSAASLTSSLITFFSPGMERFRAISSTNAGGISETLTNFSTSSVTVTIPAFPPGCCPPNSDHPHQIRCGDECVDYLSDPENCGGCGNVCGDNTCCSNGRCVSTCGEGQTLCDAECVFVSSDNDNCGTCGNSCGESGCCSGGSCHDLCGEGDTLCGSNCVDLSDNDAHCGTCFHECGEGTCCQDGECTPLLCDIPPGGWSLCGSQCVNSIHDDNNCGSCGNVCPEGSCCNGEGTCNPECFEGETNCSGQCTELANDNSNCGACGNVCGEGACCDKGECVLRCGEGRTYCNGECVDLNLDANNCGGCGNVCDGSGDCCNDGECYPYECPEQVPPVGPSCSIPSPVSPGPLHCYDQLPPQPATCPGDTARAPMTPAICPDTPSSPAGTCPESELPSPEVDEAPACLTPQSITTIPPGGSVTTCSAGGPLFKEFPTEIIVCGDGIPGVDGECNSATTHITKGTFNRLMPHPTLVPGNAFVTPYVLHVVSDTSGDGNLQPGESGGLLVELLNAGPMNITGATATLAAPAVDLTGDGLANPIGITVGTGAPAFGTIPGTPLAADCNAPKPVSATNATPYQLTVPLQHPGDTSHPLILSVTGRVDDQPFSMEVPLSLGIADRCDPAANSRDFDGIDGLSSPMGKLVPEEDPVPFPTKVFNAGQTRPLKLRMSCNGVNLTDSMIDPPQIIGLSEAIRGPLPISGLDADGPNPNNPLFRFNNTLNGGQWHYTMRTSAIGTGTFTLTIKIGGSKNYVTGFVLH